MVISGGLAPLSWTVPRCPHFYTNPCWSCHVFSFMRLTQDWPQMATCYPTQTSTTSKPGPFLQAGLA